MNYSLPLGGVFMVFRQLEKMFHIFKELCGCAKPASMNDSQIAER